MKRGTVHWAELAPRSGSEQRGRRPVVIVSHDSLKQVPSWRSVVVVPLATSRRQAERGPSAVPISAGDGGLDHESIALCHQITTLDRGKFGEHIGRLSEDAMDAVDGGLMAALDLLP